LYTRKGAQTYKKWPEMTVTGHRSIGLLQARFLFELQFYYIDILLTFTFSEMNRLPFFFEATPS